MKIETFIKKTVQLLAESGAGLFDELLAEDWYYEEEFGVTQSLDVELGVDVECPDGIGDLKIYRKCMGEKIVLILDFPGKPTIRKEYSFHLKPKAMANKIIKECEKHAKEMRDMVKMYSVTKTLTDKSHNAIGEIITFYKYYCYDIYQRVSCFEYIGGEFKLKKEDGDSFGLPSEDGIPNSYTLAELKKLKDECEVKEFAGIY